MELHTPRLKLRHVKTSDANAIFEYASDYENTKYMLWSTHNDIKDTHKYINAALAMYEKGGCYDYAIELKSTNTLIGTVGALVTGDKHLAEIGYIINKKYWGQGYAAEAANALKDYLFDEVKVHRLQAKHFLENSASGKVMKKLGMHYEGTFKDYVYVRGRYYDTVHYAIINKKD